MSEIDKIIAKYDKIFNIDRSQVDQEIQAVLPTIIEGFVEFYGEDKRQKIEEKIRNAIIFATPIDIVSKVNEMKSELNRYMREKYPGSFEFNGLNYIPVSNEQQFLDEYSEFQRKIAPYEQLGNKISTLSKQIEDKIGEEYNDELNEFVKKTLREEAGYTEEMLANYKGAIYDSNTNLGGISIFKYIAENKMNPQNINELFFIICFMRNELGIDIPKMNFEQKYPWTEENFKEAKPIYDTIIADENVKKYFPSVEVAKKIVNKVNFVGEQNQGKIKIEKMRQIYGINTLSLDYLVTTGVSFSTRGQGGYTNPFLVNNNNNMEVGCYVSVDPYEGTIECLGGTLVHEINHCIESFLNYTDNGTYRFISGWDSVQERDISSHALMSGYTPFRDYELLNEVINEFITLEVTDIIKKKTDNKMFSDYRLPAYKNGFFVLQKFYQMYKTEIIQSRQSGNMDVLFEKIGKENFESLAKLMYDVYAQMYNYGFKYDKTIDKTINAVADDDVKFYVETIAKRDEILGNMQVYSQSSHRSRGIISIYSIIISIIMIIAMIYLVLLILK